MTFTRRDFLKTSGALVVTFGEAALGGRTAAAQGPFGTRASHVDPTRVGSWIAIAPDGLVTASTGKCELGQGILTAQMQLVAEELSVPLARVRIVQCDTATTPDQGTTSGSQSTPTNFNQESLALAAATARDALVRLAAERLQAPHDTLEVADGVVRVKNDAAKRVSYGELVAGRRLEVRLDPSVKRKPKSQWTILGQPAPRVDMAAMAAGTFGFVHNVRVPRMLYGAVVRPAAAAVTVGSVNETSIRDIPGVVKVVVKKNFVGVVAEKPWNALRAAGALKVTWTGGEPLPPQADFYRWLRRQPSRDAYVVNSGDVDDRLAGAASVVKATYLHPYQMHGSMGTSCAVADVRGDRATVWSPTQSAYPTRNGVAALLGLTPDNVRVIFVRGAGCYGINGADTVSYDAAILSQAVGRPVRVQLSRKDEMAWENYGFAYAIDQRAGVDGAGGIVAWDYEAWFGSRGGRPGYDTPGNVVTGMLAGFPTAPFRPARAAEPPGEFRNGSNAAPSYIAGRTARANGGAGTIRSERVLTHTVDSPFFTGPLRSPSRLQNTFAHECFLDEIAARVKADPVAYRLRHLADARLKEVVSGAARAAGWSSRPSPSGSAGGRVAAGRGIACVAYEGDNGYAAMVAEVEVNRTTGVVTTKRLVIAHDCGPISNPDGVRNQIEGGALQGLSRALGEEVTWDSRQVTSIDWRTYHSLPLGFQIPKVECVLIDRTNVPAMGAGETAITIVAAAIGNAIFDATGVRIREVPFTPERVKRALASS
ncbi:MAG TPA: molybdopterin cofactor-binding domain-containing protein [Vicinamibacterales bacterium]